MGYRVIVDATADRGTPAEADLIEDIAAAWLAAEQELAGGSGNPAQSEINARALSERYDAADLSRDAARICASPWEAARKIQGEQEMGSEAWANARRVSELLRDEYLAAEPEQAHRPRRRRRPALRTRTRLRSRSGAGTRGSPAGPPRPTPACPTARGPGPAR